MTLQEAKNLKYGDVVYHIYLKNADKTPQRFKVNGRPHIWKKSPWRVSVPLKRGLYEYGHMDEYSVEYFYMER